MTYCWHPGWGSFAGFRPDAWANTLNAAAAAGCWSTFCADVGELTLRNGRLGSGVKGVPIWAPNISELNQVGAPAGAVRIGELFTVAAAFCCPAICCARTELPSAWPITAGGPGGAVRNPTGFGGDGNTLVLAAFLNGVHGADATCCAGASVPSGWGGATGTTWGLVAGFGMFSAADKIAIACCITWA